MKKNVLILTLLLGICSISYAQQESRTLMNKVNKWGLLLNSNVQYAEVLGEHTVFSSLKAGVVFNNSWIFGLHGGASLMEIPRRMDPINNAEFLEFSQGGLYVEYRIMPHRLVHLSIPINVGVLHSESEFHQYGPWGPYGEDNEYVNFYLEPGINLEVNISQYLKFQIGGSYRFNDAMFAPSNSDLKIPHLPMLNAGITIGIDDIPSTYKKVKKQILNK